MKQISVFLVFAMLAACAGETPRDTTLVAVEQHERSKPMLMPPGGSYYGDTTISVRNFREGLEILDGTTFTPLNSAEIKVSASRIVTVRDGKKSDLAATEQYTIVQEILPAQIYPPAGTYSGPTIITASTPLKNAYIEYKLGNDFQSYDPEVGVALQRSDSVTLRVCVGPICSVPQTHVYSIAVVTAPPPAPVVSPANLQTLVALAQGDFNQTTQWGLAARMDEAKLRVISDSTLLPDASMRSRFLAQHNDAAAAVACTTVARYLYVAAMRMAEPNQTATVLTDFADYYISHIRAGDIAANSNGDFIWIMNGSNMVLPYLPAGQSSPFEFHRGASFPTDYSLLEPVYASAPVAALMRDAPSATISTHTFAAVKTTSGYIMLDTYFTPFNGVEARASAGRAWPYGFRFGPAGSRFLHFTYGY